MSVPTYDDNPDGGTRNARYARRRRAKLATYLKVIGGVKVSQHPDAPHGTPDGYNLFGCRCLECGEHSAGPRIQQYREQRYQAAAVAVLREQGVPEDRAAELAPELIEVWRRSRGAGRQRKLTLNLARIFHGMTSDQVLTVADALVAALRNAGTGASKDEDLPTRS